MANTQINIGGNGTTTLATAGKFCNRNIDVNVAVPASGINPTGTKNITANGEHDVTNFAKANVNVPIPSGYIKPSGTKSITTNGTHDVTNYASATVNVPTGVTPTGTKEITGNGTFDVSSFANALVNVQGLNARIFTATVSDDATSGTATIAGANDWIKSIRSNANAFVIVRYLGVTASVASTNLWFNANFPLGYSGSTRYNTLVYRQTASAASYAQNVNGLTGENYSGHLCVGANGNLYVYVNGSFPVKGGTYQIIAGTFEMV